MVTDATQATLEQPGLYWRRRYAEQGDSYQPPPIEPAEPADLERRTASASETPPADSISDYSADRWALDFMQRHREPSAGIYYPAMILSAFVQAWPRDPGLSEEGWREFLGRDGMSGLACVADALEDMEDADMEEHPMIGIRAAVAEHARLKHVRRIKRLTGIEIDGYAITPGELFQLIQEIKGDLASYHNAINRKNRDSDD